VACAVTAAPSCPACGEPLERAFASREGVPARFHCAACKRDWTAPIALGNDAPDETELTNAILPRILVVDDDASVTAFLEKSLADVGVVHTATTSSYALALAKVVHPTVAIVDVVLPRMDGFELVRTMRSDRRLASTPVIFITGSARWDVAARAADVGAGAVLFKPIDTDVLRDAIRTLLLVNPR
jgi:CheY-like chemotaxis protein